MISCVSLSSIVIVADSRHSVTFNGVASKKIAGIYYLILTSNPSPYNCYSRCTNKKRYSTATTSQYPLLHTNDILHFCSILNKLSYIITIILSNYSLISRVICLWLPLEPSHNVNIMQNLLLQFIIMKKKCTRF